MMYDCRMKQALRLALLSSDECVGNFTKLRAEASYTDFQDTLDLDSHVQAVKQVLRGYFKAQRDTFPIGVTEHLVQSLMHSELGEEEQQNEPNTESAALLQDLQEVLVEWLQREHARFEGILVIALHAAAAAGFVAACDSWKERLALDLITPRATSTGLYNWAKRRATRLLALLDNTTARRITTIIIEAQNEALSVEQTTYSILAYLDGMIGHRADIGGRMEAGNAINEGVFEANKALGATAKAWITCRDALVCATCRRNEEEGHIPIEEQFPSGHSHPPAHPHCRCTILYFGVTLESALRTVDLMP